MILSSVCACACFRYRYNQTFELTYTSQSSVIMKRLSTGARFELKSGLGFEILQISIRQDRYVVAHTPDTLLLADLETNMASEIPWSGSGKEKFYFDLHPAVCLIFNAGELTVVEYVLNSLS